MCGYNISNVGDFINKINDIKRCAAQDIEFFIAELIIIF